MEAEQQSVGFSSVSSLGLASAPHDHQLSDDDDDEYLLGVAAVIRKKGVGNDEYEDTNHSNNDDSQESHHLQSSMTIANVKSLDGELQLQTSSSRFDSSIPSLSSIKFDSMPSLATISSRETRRTTNATNSMNNFDSSNYIWYDELDRIEDNVNPKEGPPNHRPNKTSTTRRSNMTESTSSSSYLDDDDAPDDLHHGIKDEDDDPNDADCEKELPPRDDQQEPQKVLDHSAFSRGGSRTKMKKRSSEIRWIDDSSQHDVMPFSPRRHSHNDIIFSSIATSPVDVFSFDQVADDFENDDDHHCSDFSGGFSTAPGTSRGTNGDTPPKPPRRRGASWESPDLPKLPIRPMCDEDLEQIATDNGLLR